MNSTPEYLKFYIEKTKDRNTNWIFLKNFPEVHGGPKSKKRWKPCHNCNKAIPTQHKFELILGKAIKCLSWEKPNNKNACPYYESKFTNEIKLLTSNKVKT